MLDVHLCVRTSFTTTLCVRAAVYASHKIKFWLHTSLCWCVYMYAHMPEASYPGPLNFFSSISGYEANMPVTSVCCTDEYLSR